MRITNEQLEELKSTYSSDPFISQLIKTIYSMKMQVSFFSRRSVFLRREYRRTLLANRLKSWHRGQSYMRSKAAHFLRERLVSLGDELIPGSYQSGYRDGVRDSLLCTVKCHVDYDRDPVGVYSDPKDSSSVG